MGGKIQTFKSAGLFNKSMKKIKIKEEEFNLEDKDVALILAIQKLTEEIGAMRLRN